MLKRGLQLLFKNRDFGMLMAAQFLAQAGDGLVQAAIGKDIAFGGQKGFDIESARSPDEILTIALLIFGPYTLLSPFLGVVIDRWDRRRLLFAANGLRALAVIGVALVGTSSVPSGVLALVFLFTLASTRIVLATKSAAMPSTLGDDELIEGNAVSQLGGALFQLGGVGVAVIAAESIDVEPIMIAGGLVFALGAFAALRIRHAAEARTPSTLGREIAAVTSNIAAGVREVSAKPAAGAAITTYFWARTLWSVSILGIALIARELLGDDDIGIAVLTGGGAVVGAGLGFFFARRLRDRVPSLAHLVLGGAFVAGAAVALFGALEMKASIAGLAFFLGLGFFVTKISLDTMVQGALGDDFRGRAFSLYDISYNVAWLLAAAIFKIAGEGNEGMLMAVSGVVFLLGLAAIGMWFRRAGLMSPDLAVPAAAPGA